MRSKFEPDFIVRDKMRQHHKANPKETIIIIVVLTIILIAFCHMTKAGDFDFYETPQEMRVLPEEPHQLRNPLDIERKENRNGESRLDAPVPSTKFDRQKGRLRNQSSKRKIQLGH